MPFLLLALVFISSYATAEYAILIPEKTRIYLEIADKIHASTKEKSSILNPLELKNIDPEKYDFFVSIGDISYDLLLELAPGKKPTLATFIQRKEDAYSHIMRIYNDFDIENQLALIKKLSTKTQINVGLIASSAEKLPLQKGIYSNINLIHKPYNREESFFNYIKRYILADDLDFFLLAPSSALTISQASLLMVHALEKNVPVIGYTKGLVDNGSGATASVYFDKDLVINETVTMIDLFSKGQFIYGSMTPATGKVITNSKLIKKFGLNAIAHGEIYGE